MLTPRLIKRPLTLIVFMMVVWVCPIEASAEPPVKKTPLARAVDKSVRPIEPLTIRGEDFIDAQGDAVRFWGVNTCAFYPSRSQASASAKHLAGRQVNLLRPHHMMRKSADWVWGSKAYALATYEKTSRQPNDDAWDRFDYFNAELRKQGIYLALALRWSRKYMPGDVDILKTTDEDRAAWKAAMKELAGWHWKKAHDVWKLLPQIDNRVAALEEEFVRRLLTHKNPYTGLTYGKDPQVLTLETMNETSAEYSLICTNRLPEYWQKQLQQRWEKFAKAQGAEPCDIYKPKTKMQRQVRAAFFRKLDEDYFLRIKKLVRSLGCDKPMTFTNLWHGENALNFHAENADFIEDHAYSNPFVVDSPDDLFLIQSRTQLADKPYFVGELNMSEWGKNLEAQKRVRTMLPVAVAAYGALQNWAGLEWFAWTHGDKSLAHDGWGKHESRAADLGTIVADGMMLDHMRTCGMIFRRGLVSPAKKTVTIVVDEPFYASSYNALLRGKYVLRPGWQNIHRIRKTFGEKPAEQDAAAWMTKDVAAVITSDTGEIIKDTTRKQLTLSVAQAEAFSGMLDGKAPAGLQTLQIPGKSGFATVVLVAADRQTLNKSQSLILSRTFLDAKNIEIDGPAIGLRGLPSPPEGKCWRIKLTRPRAAAKALKDYVNLEWMPLTFEKGVLTLPAGVWRECELQIR